MGLKIKLIKSPSSASARQVATVKGLGVWKFGSEKLLKDNEEALGDDVKDPVEAALTTLKEALKGTDNDDEVRPYRGPQDDVKFDAEAARKAFDMSFDPRPPEDDPDMRYLMRYLVGGDETPE